MLDSNTNDILTVLALVIFADKKVYASEVEAFVTSTTNVPLMGENAANLSEAKVLSWYELNREDIREKMDLPRSEFDAWLIPILKRVKAVSDPSTLTHLMEMIAVADGEVHVSERALINLLRRNWA